MDDLRFDRLVRLLRATGSRRHALTVLVSALITPLLTPLTTAAKRRGHPGNGKDATARRPHRRQKRSTPRPVRAQAVSTCFPGTSCAPGPGKNLTGCNLSDSSVLRGKRCNGCNLSTVNLSRADARTANLSGVNLGGACLVDTNLSGASLRGANSGTAIFCRTIMPDGRVNNRDCDKGTPCCRTDLSCDVCRSGCPFSTVQAAVDAAAPGATLRLCPERFGPATIGKDLTIIGAGRDATTLDAEGEGSVISVDIGATVTIRGVTISGGTGTLNPDIDRLEGGGVFNQGVLTLADVLVSANQAERGGGILNDFQARLTLDQTLVADNTVLTRRSEGTFGGGILNLRGATLTVRNGSAVVRNRGLNSAGIHNNGTLEISDSDVRDNIAGIDGGGIINDGGLMTLRNARVRDNVADRGRGGGIFHLGFTLTIDNGSEIRHNRAGATGGGIFNGQVARLDCSDAAILDNAAGQDGGAIFNNGGRVSLTNTPVRGNTAGGNGGGIYQVGQRRSEPASLRLVKTVIRDNTADGDGGGVFTTEPGVVTLDAQSRVIANTPNNCVGTAACSA